MTSWALAFVGVRIDNFSTHAEKLDVGAKG